jgi:hypothetical protein
MRTVRVETREMFGFPDAKNPGKTYVGQSGVTPGTYVVRWDW